MIHALPGTGADHRMFPPPWDELPGFRAHDWPAAPGIATVRDLAALVVERWAIADGDVVVGASLGGMVACEISRLRRLRALALVGGAAGAGEVNALFRGIRPLLPLVPLDFLRRAAASLPGELMQMFAAGDPAFIRAMCIAIADWNGTEPWPAPLWRVHGLRDLVIPPPPRADLLLEAGHLVAMTHAAACVAFLRDRLA